RNRVCFCLAIQTVSYAVRHARISARQTNNLAGIFVELLGADHLVKVASSFPEVSQNEILTSLHHADLLKQKPTTLCMMIPITGLWWEPRMKSSLSNAPSQLMDIKQA